MGMSCCKCEENNKEKEMVIPEKIKYNFYEINQIAKQNFNNDNIISNLNEQDLMSNNSQGFEIEKKFDSIDNSSYNNNRFHKNSSSKKSPFLGQIKEKDKSEEEQEDKDYNNRGRGSSELERVSVNQIIDNIDKIIYKDKNNNININNNENNMDFNELKRMDEINNQKNFVIDNCNKMSHYNIDNEGQRKVKGDDNNIVDNNFDNSDEAFLIERNSDVNNNKYNNDNQSLENEENNKINISNDINNNISLENFKNIDNNELFEIEINEMENNNYHNDNTDKLKTKIKNNEDNYNINDFPIKGNKSNNMDNSKGNDNIYKDDIDSVNNYDFNNDYKIYENNENDYNEAPIFKQSLDDNEKNESKINLFHKKTIIRLSKNDF